MSNASRSLLRMRLTISVCRVLCSHTTHTHSQAHSQQRTTYTIRHAATAPSLYKEINQ